jgi:hypothetical protein
MTLSGSAEKQNSEANSEWQEASPLQYHELLQS